MTDPGQVWTIAELIGVRVRFPRFSHLTLKEKTAMSSDAPIPGGANLVMVKATFLHSPHSGRFEKATNAGVWLESLDFTAAIQRAAAGVGQAAMTPDKQFLKGR